MSYNIRSYNIEKLYHVSKNIYRSYFKHNTPWGLKVQDLLKFPKFSLGRDLASFLKQNEFEVEPKLENHDVFHVLTGCGTKVYEEVALQYFLLGNGKVSLYLFLVILTGTPCYPEKWSLFWQYFWMGKQAVKFYHLDFKPLLISATNDIRSRHKIKVINGWPHY